MKSSKSSNDAEINPELLVESVKRGDQDNDLIEYYLKLPNFFSNFNINKLLLDSFEKDHVFILRTLIRIRKLDINQPPPFNSGTSYLHLAVENNAVQIVAFLLEKNASQSADSQGQYPLHITVRKDYEKILSLLLKRNPVISQMQDSENNTPLHLAVSMRQIDFACALYRSDIKSILTPGNQRKTPIELAWQQPDRELFNKLCNEIFKSDDKESLEVVLELMKNDFHDTTEKTKKITVCIKKAAQWNSLSILTWLLDRPGYSLEKEELRVFIYFGDIKVLEWLDRKGYFRKYEGEYEILALTAISKGRYQILRWLIKQQGYLPSDSTRLEFFEFFKRLLHLYDQCSPDKKQQYWYPIHLVVACGQYDLLLFLLATKCFLLSDKNENGEDVLFAAVAYGQLLILPSLIKKLPDSMDLKNKQGRNLILHAVVHGQLDTVKWLIAEMKYSLSSLKKMLDQHNHNPLDLAVLHGRQEIVEYFVKDCGFELEPQGSEGRNVLTGILGGQLNMIQRLVNEMGCSLIPEILHDTCRLSSIMNDGKLNPVLLAGSQGQLEILKWLVYEKKISFSVNNATECEKLLEKALSFPCNTFIFTMIEACLAFQQIGELESLLATLEKKAISAPSSGERKKIYECYENIVEKLYSVNRSDCELALQSYRRISFAYEDIQAIDFQINFLLRNGQIQEAAALCMDILNDPSSDQNEQTAVKMKLAELLFQYDLFEEEDSPLENNDKHLKDNNCAIKRAIQAAYLLRDLDPQTRQIRDRLNLILSGAGNKIGDYQSHYCIETWQKRAKLYYLAYSGYKENNKIQLEFAISAIKKLDQKFSSKKSFLFANTSKKRKPDESLEEKLEERPIISKQKNAEEKDEIEFQEKLEEKPKEKISTTKEKNKEEVAEGKEAKEEKDFLGIRFNQ